jgi:hypothetical protein
MLVKAALLLLFATFFVSSDDVSRKEAKAQPESTAAPVRLAVKNDPLQSETLSIEVFQVFELPLNVHEASLVKSDKGYFLKLALGNSSELGMIGLRYSLARINIKNQPQPIANRTEGFSIAPYATKILTFKTPIRFKPRDGERLVLMLEQVISRESIWEVVKAKDAFEAYARGDYSVTPAVLRVANQVDAPMVPQRIFFERH